MEFTVNKPYFVISGLELDVEFDYVSEDERDYAADELEQFIETEGIEPRIGTTLIHEDDIIYIPSSRTIDYAETMFYYAEFAS